MRSLPMRVRPRATIVVFAPALSNSRTFGKHLEISISGSVTEVRTGASRESFRMRPGSLKFPVISGRKKLSATIDRLRGVAMIGLRFAADDLRHRIPTSDGSSAVGKVSAVVPSFVLWQLGWRALSSRRSRDVTLTLNAQ